jgi:hypothetical protein
MKRKNYSIQLTFGWLGLALALLLISSVAYAQTGARVYLQPVNAAADTLTVDVIAENVTELYGAEFRLKYDPAMVAVQDLKAEQEGIQIEPGSLLPVDQGFVVANQVNEAEGTVTFALTLLNPAPAVSGSGPLARITFKVLQNSPSTLTIERAKLVAVDLQTIPSETVAFTIGQDQQETAAATTPVDQPPAGEPNTFPWWLVAVIVMILGIVALGSFILLGGPKSGSTASITPQTTGRRPGQMTGRRPSAFREQASSTDWVQKL